MATSNKPISSIAMALAGMTASVDIPKPRANDAWTGKDSFAAVAAGPLQGNKQQQQQQQQQQLTAGLPTPPNSISPSLPPQNVFKERDTSAPPTPPGQAADSDFDLQDAVEHAAAQDKPERTAKSRLASIDTAGAITPTLLATHHLPDILLAHGPLAIRHIMGHLTNSVPGFSRMPSAKARRLVVGALEGRGGPHGEAAGGVHGDVLFEKVGWGRWDATQRGQPPRVRRQASPVATRHPNALGALRSPSPYATRTLRIPHRPAPRARLPSATSLAFSHRSAKLSPYHGETEADGMSLEGASDEDRSLRSSDPPSDEGDDDMGDVTDEEDWAGIGAAALRAGSFPKEMLNRRPGKELPKDQMRRGMEFERRIPSSHLAKSAPGFGAEIRAWQQKTQAAENSPLLDPVLMEGVGEDESEAVRALMQLGSV